MFSKIKSDAVREALENLASRTRRAIFVVVALLLVAGAITGYSLDSENRQLSREVAALREIVGELESSIQELEQADSNHQFRIEAAEERTKILFQNFDELEKSCIPPAAQSVEEPKDPATVPMFSVEVTKFAALNRGNGAFTIRTHCKTLLKQIIIQARLKNA